MGRFVIALFVGALAVAVPASAYGATRVPAVNTGACFSSQPAVHPRNIVIACADGNDQLTGLRWSTWGPYTATANGTETWNICVPYCAASNQWAFVPVQVVLSDVVSTAHGPRFTMLQWRRQVSPKTERYVRGTGWQVEWKPWQSMSVYSGAKEG